MKPVEFVAKWSRIQQKETAVYVSHFEDICRLVGHATPLAHDPGGERFSFQTATTKADGQKGFADVYFRDHFIWEYKGPHADLGKAYRQLQLYRESLDNPPLLITSDIHTIHIHSNFTNRPVVETVVTLDDIAKGPGVEVLRRVFFDPDSFMPEKTRENITRATADTFLTVAESLRQHQRLTGEAYTPEQRAHFLIRLLFCLFAEDLGLLPDGLFTQLVKAQGKTYSDLREPLKKLFAAMRGGGHFGLWAIRWFNGTLFDDEFVPALPVDLAGKVRRAAEQDWSAVDPSIFGTLFERIIDEDKRAQLGAHYTSRDDILLIVEPVLMEPLRRRWDKIRREVESLLRDTKYEIRDTSEEDAPNSYLVSRISYLLNQFAAELASIRVLDPACGSGNFLYVALRRLLDLQKEVIAYAARQGLPEIPLTVGPEQLYGIEVNEYAHELAQVTAWIGYLQWRHENGFAEMDDPVLRPLDNIRHMDAILAHDADGNPVEPEWPAAEVIVGNPPFLGDKKMRAELGEKYVRHVRNLYGQRIPGQSDLVCYWFERARDQIARKKSLRVGLLATNSIRQSQNRKVLERIKQDGDISMAWSDREWMLDGAAVNVSMVGFDDGTQTQRTLDGIMVTTINSNLTSAIDLTFAVRLDENSRISFIGTQKNGDFDIDEMLAKRMISSENVSGVSNRDVVKPWVNGNDLTGRPRNRWVIDFGVYLSLEEAIQYEVPFKYLEDNVKGFRLTNHRKAYRDWWWIHAEPRPALRNALILLKRYIATSIVAKHRFFVWLGTDVIPDKRLTVIARDDDYFFGALSSKIHLIWSLAQGSTLEDRPSYTPTTTFETFPFPWPPGEEPQADPDLTGGRDAHLSGLVADIAR